MLFRMKANALKENKLRKNNVDVLLKKQNITILNYKGFNN